MNTQTLTDTQPIETGPHLRALLAELETQSHIQTVGSIQHDPTPPVLWRGRLKKIILLYYDVL